MLNKGKRPYVGILYITNDFKYIVPLTSLKEKKAAGKDIPRNGLTFRRLDEGNRGGVHIGNMIPVPEDCMTYLDFDCLEDGDYKKGMLTQYSFILKEWDVIQNNAAKLYKIHNMKNIKREYKRKIKANCCNFTLLEKACSEYIN